MRFCAIALLVSETFFRRLESVLIILLMRSIAIWRRRLSVSLSSLIESKSLRIESDSASRFIPSTVNMSCRMASTSSEPRRSRESGNFDFASLMDLT